jgi:hypothetical protein
MEHKEGSYVLDPNRESIARRGVIDAVFALLAVDHSEPGDASRDDALDHAEEALAFAARELVDATDGLPDSALPVGWLRRTTPRKETE